MSDEAPELLSEIRDLLAALPAAITVAVERQRCAPRRLSPADEAALSALLPVIATAVCGRKFSVRELREHAQLNVAPALALRDALASIDPRKLGRLLRRGCDNDVDGYRVKEVDFTRDGVIRREHALVPLGSRVPAGQ